MGEHHALGNAYAYVLRTTEFLWQEGHTAHATPEEAMEETLQMLEIYARFSEDYLAMPVIKGEKTPSERFPGADNTYTIEAMMQDKKALQAGTSHFLGQHFSKSFNIKYLSSKGTEEFVWTTSWGSTTRLIGALIMTHSDDDGLVLPPKIAPSHVVILPIIHKEEDRARITEYCQQLAAELRKIQYHGRSIGVEVDTRDLTGGEKAWGWVKKGIPVRIEIGNKDMASDSVFMGRRDKGYKEKTSVPRQEFINNLVSTLDEMQTNLFNRAKKFQQDNIAVINSRDELYEYFQGDSGFALAHWNGDAAIEAQVKQDLGVTIRCMPFENDGPGKCIFTGEPSRQRVIFAKAY